MIDFLFTLPLAVAGLIILLALWLYAAIGLAFVRHWLLPQLHIRIEDSEFKGTMVQSVMVFYGLAVALIAVSVWQTYSDVSKIVSEEATQSAALYLDVSGYPEPHRSLLQSGLRDYVEYVIHEAWPRQKKGEVPKEGVVILNRFKNTLLPFEPVTEGQKLLHGETLRAYNQLIHARRLRIDAVETRLPTIMWMVVFVGAAISLSTSFLFKVEDVRLHGIMVIFLATFMALIIFMIFALDRPFHGEVGLSPEPYQLVYDQIMKPG
jgi:hypothetical protein